MRSQTHLTFWANVSIAFKAVRNRRHDRIELPLLIAWIDQLYQMYATVTAGISCTPVENVFTSVSGEDPPTLSSPLICSLVSRPRPDFCSGGYSPRADVPHRQGGAPVWRGEANNSAIRRTSLVFPTRRHKVRRSCRTWAQPSEGSQKRGAKARLGQGSVWRSHAAATCPRSYCSEKRCVRRSR